MNTVSFPSSLLVALLSLLGAANALTGHKEAGKQAYPGKAEDLTQQTFIDQFRAMSDVELCECFQHLKWPDEDFSNALDRQKQSVKHREMCLTEMAHRRSVKIENFLSRDSRVEVLTALRRLQKKTDPLRIIVTGRQNRECIYPRLPEFALALKNVDVEKEAVPIKAGGNNHSGRQDRWRFEVRDARGNPMAIKQVWGELGGGFAKASLKFGDSWKTMLDMSRYIDLEPGDYKVRIQYHDHVLISNYKSTFGLILSESDPISLHVQPRIIDTKKQDKNEARNWLAKLDEKTELQILAGGYDEHAHNFIKPDSPPGRLLTLAWKAIPTLLEELDEERLTPSKRAWILALLFSITGQNDPRTQFGVIGSYSYRETGWDISGGLDEQNSSGVLGFGRSGWAGGKLDVIKQREFAKRWERFKENNIVVRER
jgi:hypothetical protein